MTSTCFTYNPKMDTPKNASCGRSPWVVVLVKRPHS
jgi:hypothetical protein